MVWRANSEQQIGKEEQEKKATATTILWKLLTFCFIKLQRITRINEMKFSLSLFCCFTGSSFVLHAKSLRCECVCVHGVFILFFFFSFLLAFFGSLWYSLHLVQTKLIYTKNFLFYILHMCHAMRCDASVLLFFFYTFWFPFCWI